MAAAVKLERLRGPLRCAEGQGFPDHTEKRILFDPLAAEAHAGVRLTESFAMVPAASIVTRSRIMPGARACR
jgi:5-methyltetrahydrofolate--homocysteine methyltransferase